MPFVGFTDGQSRIHDGTSFFLSLFKVLLRGIEPDLCQQICPDACLCLTVRKPENVLNAVKNRWIFSRIRMSCCETTDEKYQDGRRGGKLTLKAMM